MKDDPLIEEARRAGQQYIDSFKGDWSAVIADLQRRAREAGRNIVSPPPKPPKTASIQPVKKAG